MVYQSTNGGFIISRVPYTMGPQMQSHGGTDIVPLNLSFSLHSTFLTRRDRTRTQSHTRSNLGDSKTPAVMNFRKSTCTKLPRSRKSDGKSGNRRHARGKKLVRGKKSGEGILSHSFFALFSRPTFTASQVSTTSTFNILFTVQRTTPLPVKI